MSKHLTVLDMTRNEIQNAIFQNLASAPSTPTKGLYYFDTTLNKLGYWDGTAWVYSSVDPNTVTQTANSANAGKLKVSQGANRVVVDYSGTAGIVKVGATGDVAIATAGVTSGDYIAPSSVDIDGTLTANSDAKIPTQKAVKTYIDALLNASDAMVFKGAIDCSANPNYPAASAGHTYKVSVAGKIGGASGLDVTVGDTLYCTLDGSASGTQAAVGANWVIVQANVDRATTSALGLTQYATSTEAEAKTDTTKSVTPSALANFPVKKTFTIGDGSATSIACTHNLGTQDVIVSVRQASDNAEVVCDIVHTSTSVVTLSFAVAPTSNALKVVIIG